MPWDRLFIAICSLALSACGGGSQSDSTPPDGTQFTLQVGLTGNAGPVKFQWQGQSFSVSTNQTVHSSQGQSFAEPDGFVMPAEQSCDILFTKLSAHNGSLQLTCHALQEFTLQLEVQGNTAPLAFRWLGQPYQLSQQLTLRQRAVRYEAPSDWSFPVDNKCKSTQKQLDDTSYLLQLTCDPAKLTVQLPQQLPYTAYLRYQNKSIPVKAATTLKLDSTEPETTPQLTGSDGPQQCVLQPQDSKTWQLQCKEFALVYGKAAADSAAALQLLQSDGQSVPLDTQAAAETGIVAANQQLFYLQSDGLHQLKMNNGRYEAGPLQLPGATGIATAERPASAQLLALTPKTLYRLEQDQWVRLRDTPGTLFQAPLYGGLDRVSWLSQPEPDKPLSLWQRAASDKNLFASAPAGRRSAAAGAVEIFDRRVQSSEETAEILIWPSWDQQVLVLDYLASSKVELTRLPASQSPTLWQTAPHRWLISRLNNQQIELYRYNTAQGFYWQAFQRSSGNWLAGTGSTLVVGQLKDGMVTLTDLLRYPQESLLSSLLSATASNTPLEISAARNGSESETGLAPKLARDGWLLLYQAGTVWLTDGTLMYRLAGNISREHYQQWQLLSVGPTLAVVRDHRQLLLPIALR